MPPHAARPATARGAAAGIHGAARRADRVHYLSSAGFGDTLAFRFCARCLARLAAACVSGRITAAEGTRLAKKPNYDFEKRRKELERKQKKDAKREERLYRKRHGLPEEGDPVEGEDADGEPAADAPAAQ